MAGAHKTRNAANGLIIIGATIAIVVLVNILSSALFARADMTENGLNSLSEIAKETVAGLDDLEVRVYISPDLPETIQGETGQELVLRGIEQRFRDKLEEYRSYSDGNMHIVYVTDDVVEQAKKAKLRVFAGEEATTNKGRLEFKQYALGASFHYKNVMEVLPLALYPEYYEFEITKILLRLREKAEKSLLMKDVLAAGAKVDTAVQGCVKEIEAVEPEEEEPTNPFGLLSAEASQARIDAYRSALPKIKQACAAVGTAVAGASSNKGRHKALDSVLEAAQGFDQAQTQFIAAVGGNADAQSKALNLVEQLKTIGEAVDSRHDDLVDSPGRKSIGFVCAGKAFCPFPDDKPLVPPELQGALAQKNPMIQQILPGLDQMSQRINGILRNVERSLFRQRGFNIVRVNLDEPIPDDVQALVVLGPKAKLDPYALYLIDQFVLGGGSLVVFLNEWDVSLYNIEPNSEEFTLTKLAPNSGNIEELLASWGIAPNRDIVMEPESHDMITVLSLIRQGQLNWQTQRSFPYPMLPILTDFDDSSPLVRAVPSLTLPFVSSMTLADKPDTTITPLIFTSPDAVTTTDSNFPLEPGAQLNRVRQQSGRQRLVVGAVATGKLSSFYAGKDKPEAPKKEGEDADEKQKEEPARLDSGEGRVLVIGSNLGLEDLSAATILDGFNIGMLTDGSFEIADKFRSWAANLQNWQVRLMQIQHTLQDNLQFVFNALDWAIQQEGLVEIRSKQYTRRPLEPIDEADQAWILTAATAGTPIAFMLVGLVLWIMRRSRRKRLTV